MTTLMNADASECEQRSMCWLTGDASEREQRGLSERE